MPCAFFASDTANHVAIIGSGAQAVTQQLELQAFFTYTLLTGKHYETDVRPHEVLG